MKPLFLFKKFRSEYWTWGAMKDRCYNTKCKDFAYYGGRGIKVCDRWRKSFENFISDMGQRPAGMKLDRINNDGDYEPGNCRWSTHLEQCNNQRSNWKVTFDGQTKTIGEWARTIGINRKLLYSRIVIRCWPIGKALTASLGKQRNQLDQ